MGETYERAGVSIAAGDAAVQRIKPHVRSTRRPGVLGDIGGFGGLFELAPLGYRDPVLVSTTDGVGTKALVAHQARRYDTIGIDLVAMCVDDLVCVGAEPLFFLDYVAIGRLDVDQMDQLVAGVAAGCRAAGCALIGGEMAEHPAAMRPGEFDLAGFAVGAVERDRMVTGASTEPGDAIIGLASPNLRSNGFSLARRIFFEVAGRAPADPAWEGAPHTVADELLQPSVIYTPAVRATLADVDVHAIAHITGGGLPGNLSRVLDGVDAVIERGTWTPPRVFGELQRLGDVDDREMFRVFNMGIGMTLVVARRDAERACDRLCDSGVAATVIGRIDHGRGEVRID